MSNYNYPEHAKQREVFEETSAVITFLEWLGNNGIFLAENRRFEDSERPQLAIVSKSYPQIVADHYGIDLTKIEEERRIMIAQLQQHQAEEI